MTARDFGLQALDLQKQGFSMFGDERDRRFDQKVKGIEDETRRGNDARSLSLFNAANEVALSDRNQRQGLADDRLEGELGLNKDFYGKNRGSADTMLGTNTRNIDNIYTQRREDQGLKFNSLTALADQKYKTNMGAAGDIFSAGNTLTGSLYTGNMNALGKYYDTSANAAQWAHGQKIGARENYFTQMAGALGSQAQVAIGAQAQDAANAQSAQNSQNALWGSAVNSAMALGGDLFGSLYKPRTTTTNSNPFNSSGTGNSLGGSYA
jgi:hypothetical protein